MYGLVNKAVEGLVRSRFGDDAWDKIRIKAKVTQGLIPGAISIRHGHGFGHWAMGSVAKGNGAHSNNLMDSYTSPITGANCYNECKVRIRSAT